MLAYLRRRLLAAVPVVLGVSVLVFSMQHLIPGDPVAALAGEQVLADPDRLRLFREQLGLDDPLPVQYWHYVSGVLRGDLGRSLRSQRPVFDEIVLQLGSTVSLAVAAMFVATAGGLGLGALAAVHHRSWIDTFTMFFALAGASLPSFWLALVLILVFSLGLGWFPATGTEGLNRLVLPTVALSLSAMAVIARLVRSSLLEVLRQEYVLTARAKGIQPRYVLQRHVLKNALIPVITVMGLQLGHLLAGAVIVETVFSRQGIGRLLIQALMSRDFPLVQGIVLLVAVTYVLLNLAVDVSYSLIDPRVRYS